jgi:hypothetical protein
VQTFAPSPPPRSCPLCTRLGRGGQWPPSHVHLAGGRLTSHGWAHQMVLVTGADVTQPITLGGQVVTRGLGPLWFSLGDEGQATTTLTVDPRAISPSAGDGEHGRYRRVFGRRVATSSTPSLDRSLPAAFRCRPIARRASTAESPGDSHRLSPSASRRACAPADRRSVCSTPSVCLAKDLRVGPGIRPVGGDTACRRHRRPVGPASPACVA